MGVSSLKRLTVYMLGNMKTVIELNVDRKGLFKNLVSRIVKGQASMKVLQDFLKNCMNFVSGGRQVLRFRYDGTPKTSLNVRRL